MQPSPRLLFAVVLTFPFLLRAEEPLLPEIQVTDTSLSSSQEVISAFTTVVTPRRVATEMRSLPEVLDTTVSVTTTDLGGLGQLSTVSVRGSSAEQVAVFLDGVKINTAGAGGVDFSSLPIDAVERIEVIRGGSSARFGTDAIGGVVNITTKQHQPERRAEVRLTGGSFSTFKSALSLVEPHERWNLTAAHTHLSSNGDYSFISAPTNLAGTTIGGGRAFTRLHNRSISEDLLAKATLDLSDKLHLHLSNDFFWADRQIPGTEEETTLLFPANPLDAEETIFRNTTGVRLRGDRFISDALAWEVGLSNHLFHNNFNDATPAIGNPIDVAFANNSVTGSAALFHTITRERVELLTTLRTHYQLDLADDSSPLPGTALQGTQVRHTSALFVETDIGLFASRLIFSPLIRFEDASDRRARASWQLGILAKPVKQIDFKANAQTSHRYPTFNELYFPDHGYLRGNPNLNDEESVGWDVGVVLHPQQLSVELSYFQNFIDDSILFVPVSATTIQPVNTARVDAHGVELAASFEPIPAIMATANYTWLNATFPSNGLRLPGRPEHKVNSRLEGRYSFISLFGELQYVGRYPINTANTVFLSERTTMNLGTTARFAKRFFATFEAKDITDVQIYDARGFPLPRRSFWLTVGAKA